MKRTNYRRQLAAFALAAGLSLGIVTVTAQIAPAADSSHASISRSQVNGI